MVLDHETLARIEVPRDHLEEALESNARQRIIDGCKEVGYTIETTETKKDVKTAPSEIPILELTIPATIPHRVRLRSISCLSWSLGPPS